MYFALDTNAALRDRWTRPPQPLADEQDAETPRQRQGERGPQWGRGCKSF